LVELIYDMFESAIRFVLPERIESPCGIKMQKIPESG